MILDNNSLTARDAPLYEIMHYEGTNDSNVEYTSMYFVL